MVAEVRIDLRVGAIVRAEAIGGVQTEGHVVLDRFNAEDVVEEAAGEDRDVAGRAEGFNFLVAELRNDREVVGRDELPAGGFERARELDADRGFKDVHVLLVVEGHGIGVDARVAKTHVRNDGEGAVLVGREVAANTERDRRGVGGVAETREVIAEVDVAEVSLDVEAGEVLRGVDGETDEASWREHRLRCQRQPYRP